MSVESAFRSLEQYNVKQEFRGYDPYDILNAKIPFNRLGKWPAAIATQIQKRNPVNIRSLLGIKKGVNPKAFGLFLQAYSLLYKQTKNIEYLQKARYFFEWLRSNYSEGYSGKCWGYNFSWANPQHFYKPYTPSSVVTAFVIRGVWEYYMVTGREEAVDLILSAAKFITLDIPTTEEEGGLCFSYTPFQKDLCFNSSLLATEILARAHFITKDDNFKQKVIKAVNWAIEYQREDGRWNYSIDPITGLQRKQIDFHQGYILESIHEIKSLLAYKTDRWDNSIKLGLEYYKNYQFNNEGRSYWRVPKKYPIDVHNQAQGIITLTKLAEYGSNSYEFASRILNWTIFNMQDKKGYFYYRGYKYYKNKISYMRWNNAWMFLALTIYKSVEYQVQHNEESS
jgi:hypothetical protein